ncbi:MAG: copper resistance protein NlpE N-terminal domain-containing protein [Phycisphaerales bacterium]
MGLGKGIGLFFMILGVCSVAVAGARTQVGNQMPAPDRERIAPMEVAGLGKLPASFEGDLPAPDGPRIHYHLDLYPGQVFVLRLTEPGRDAPIDQIGKWAVSGDGGRLMLTSEGMISRLYAIGDTRTLHTLDPAAQAMEPPSSYDLTRIWPFAPVEPTLLLHGMYGRAGNETVFEDCQTGWRLPVAPEGDGKTMESAYSKANGGSNEPLFVTLVGTIAQRPDADGEGTQASLVVDRFVGAWPSETCGR